MFFGSDNDPLVNEAVSHSLANHAVGEASKAMLATPVEDGRQDRRENPPATESDKHGSAVHGSISTEQSQILLTVSNRHLLLPILSQDQQTHTQLLVSLANETYFEVITLERCLTFDAMRSAVLTASGYTGEDGQFLHAIVARFAWHCAAMNVDSVEKHRAMLLRIEAWHNSKERSIEHGICDIFIELIFEAGL